MGNPRYILVTGANKGIGLAAVQMILDQNPSNQVFLGSRSIERGNIAKRSIDPAYAGRVHVVPLDVTSTSSVQKAVQLVQETLSGERLYAIVNNAGIASGTLAQILGVNVYGVQRVCESFLPLLDPQKGRVVVVSSAAGPSFVASCSTEQKDFLTAPTPWPALDAFMQSCLAIPTAQDFAARGLGNGSSYHLSKACVNTYTLRLAHTHPSLRINACTPGFIETDLTRPMAAAYGKTPQELGMKSPKDGTVSISFLLFGDPPGNGRYYGSDALRSPLDRYRSPGDPPYTGSN